MKKKNKKTKKIKRILVEKDVPRLGRMTGLATLDPDIEPAEDWDRFSRFTAIG